jgi:effector-binding domain-containing protein
LKELREYVKSHNLKPVYHPFSIYYSITKDEIDFLTGIPVQHQGKNTNTIKSGKIDSCETAVLDYYGSYSGIEKGYEVMKKWMVNNKRVLSGEQFQLYVVNPLNENDSTKWLTKIFFPIK